MAPAFTTVSPISLRPISLRPFSHAPCPHRPRPLTSRRTSPRAMAVPAPPEGVSVKSIPFLGTLVLVSNPAAMATIDRLPDVVRGDYWVPSWLRSMLFATQFASPAHGGEWCMAFTRTGIADQARRRKRVEDNLETILSNDRVNKLVEMARGDMPVGDVAKSIMRLMGADVVGYDGVLPEEVLDWLSHIDLAKIINPFGYFRSRSSRKKLEQWVQRQFPRETYYIDIVHDLDTLYHGLSNALVAMRNAEPADDIYAHMAKNATLPITLRVTTGPSDLGGMLARRPLKGRSVLVFNLLEAARSSGSVDYVFGTGNQERQCPFRKYLLQIGETVLSK